MRTTRRAMTRTRPLRHDHPGHSKAKCLKVFRQLSAYLDEELDADLCREIRRHLVTCRNCDVFLDSLRWTIALCQRNRPSGLTPSLRAKIQRRILDAAGRCTPSA